MAARSELNPFSRCQDFPMLVFVYSLHFSSCKSKFQCSVFSSKLFLLFGRLVDDHLFGLQVSLFKELSCVGMLTWHDTFTKYYLTMQVYVVVQVHVVVQVTVVMVAVLTRVLGYLSCWLP